MALGLPQPLTEMSTRNIFCGVRWQEDKEEDVGNYWMTLRKGDDTLI
jgi:hypothetical protein